jgi:DNA helicase-2/ATP-dependent DNA helicase PcrA
MLVLGGPGSGKTTMALLKANKEIESGSLKRGQRILFLSFARATISRVAEQTLVKLTKENSKLVELNTYHGFSWNVLRSHGYLLRKSRNLRVFPPAEAASHLVDIAEDNRAQELSRLFLDDGLVHFDFFASLTATLFERSRALRNIYCDAYPLIIVDEFQDTNEDEWSLIKALGEKSRIIALADPDQRIYEFRGADPRRIGEFSTAFSPTTFDFGIENHRSTNTDIVVFANDLLRGELLGNTYQNVKTIHYGFYQGKEELFFAKKELLQSLKRVRKKKGDGGSVALLVPSNRLMLQLSDYLSKQVDNLPAIYHSVALDAEGPALAASVIAVLLEAATDSAEDKQKLLHALVTHIRGRSGARGPSQSNLELGKALASHIAGEKIRGKKRLAIIAECDVICSRRAAMQLTGDPGKDWLLVRQLLSDCSCDVIKQVADDAKSLRLFGKGAILRSRLNEIWRNTGGYEGALRAVNDALLQEHFAASSHEAKGVYVMTIHKAKGKDFDEVVVFEGRYNGIVRANSTAAEVAQARLALRVAVTRARMNAVIVTPKDKPCPLLS